MSTDATAALQTAATDRGTDVVDQLEFSPETGKRAIYEAWSFERAGDLVRVWNESHAESDEHVYAVELDSDDVPVSCTCPAYEYHCEGAEVCKHAVAVALHLPAIDDQAIVTDGGVVLEDDGSDPWGGPHLEYDKYGEPTRERFYRCRDCGVEVLEGVDRTNVSHREDCEVSR